MEKRDENEINTEKLKIVGNIIKFENSLIQIKNISYITTMKLTKEKFPFLISLIGLLGAVGFIKTDYKLLSVLSIIFSGIYIYDQWYRKNRERLTTTVLSIVVNSGNVLEFVVKEKTFLEKIVYVLERIIIENGIEKNSEISINIKDCSFGGDAQVLNNLGIK